MRPAGLLRVFTSFLASPMVRKSENHVFLRPTGPPVVANYLILSSPFDPHFAENLKTTCFYGRPDHPLLQSTVFYRARGNPDFGEIGNPRVFTVDRATRCCKAPCFTMPVETRISGATCLRPFRRRRAQYAVFSVYSGARGRPWPRGPPRGRRKAPGGETFLKHMKTRGGPKVRSPEPREKCL